MFWLGPHMGMTLPFREEGKNILEWSLPIDLSIIHQHPQTSLRHPPVSYTNIALNYPTPILPLKHLLRQNFLPTRSPTFPLRCWASPRYTQDTPASHLCHMWDTA